MKQHTGEGVGGVIGLVIWILLNVVSAFVIPSEVGKMYTRDGHELRSRRSSGHHCRRTEDRRTCHLQRPRAPDLPGYGFMNAEPIRMIAITTVKAKSANITRSKSGFSALSPSRST